MNRSIQALTDATRKRSSTAEQAVRKALRQARKDTSPITVKGIAMAAGVSTDFIYRHPELRTQVETLRRARRPAPSAAAVHDSDTETASSTLVRRLAQELADARRKHHEEVTELRRALEVAHGELLMLRRTLETMPPAVPT
ncbi:DUF6262 family protein [Streptomyces sp. NPDC050516]|uniref:DUF6262 family protein n=1 Tax=Streptomyces sp. NPDC050516 TaxID=3365621 RepID=UPI0037B6F60C